MGFEHRLDGGAQALKIGVTDDAGARPQLAVAAAGRHGGDAVDEFRLADRSVGGIAVRPVHRRALEIDRGKNVVAGVDVLQQLVEEIARLPVPQVMVRIDDRPLRFDRFLDHGRKPALVQRKVDGRPCRLVAHGVLSLRCAW